MEKIMQGDGPFQLCTAVRCCLSTCTDPTASLSWGWEHTGEEQEIKPLYCHPGTDPQNHPNVAWEACRFPQRAVISHCLKVEGAHRLQVVSALESRASRKQRWDSSDSKSMPAVPLPAQLQCCWDGNC